jgi:adenosine kinase
MKIFVSGSLAYDRIMDFPGKFSDHILADKIHTMNVCFMVNDLIERFGGTAGNIAYNLALLGERPMILTAVGKDFNAYKAWLKKLDLPFDGIRELTDKLTAGAYITTDQTDNQITTFYPGAMNHSSVYGFKGLQKGTAIGIISPGNLDDMLVYSRRYKEIGIPYIFDPGQATTALSAKKLTEMITGSEIFISNDYELELIKNSTKMNTSDILGHTSAMITTRGEKGSVLITRDEKTEIPPVPPERVIDPTGAGDAYRSGLIKGMILKKDLITSARMGATSASFAVEFQGTQEHHFSLETFWERFDKTFS